MNSAAVLDLIASALAVAVGVVGLVGLVAAVAAGD